MCIHKTATGECTKLSDGGATEYCVEGPCPDDTPTNADRIRGMSDVDLAKFIGAVATKDWEFRTLYGGYSAAFDWLRQPAEEVHDGQ